MDDAAPPSTTEPSPARKPSASGYAWALGLLVVSLGGFWLAVMVENRRVAEAIDAAVPFVAPGSAEFEAASAGRYLVYHRFQGEHKGQRFDQEPRLVWPYREIVALRVTASALDVEGGGEAPTAALTGDKTDQDIADRKGGPEPHNWATQVRRPEFLAAAVYRIDVPAPGRYRVEARWRDDLAPPVYTDPAAYAAETARRESEAQAAGKPVAEMGFEPAYLVPLEPEPPAVLLAVGPDIAGDRFHRVWGLRGAAALAGLGLTGAGVLAAVTYGRRTRRHW
ncbi:MAG: hypothetical protein AAGA57_01685 [Planctomycetota bacterium]